VTIGPDQFDQRYMEPLKAARGHWCIQGMHDIAFELDGPSDVLDAGCGGALLSWAATLASPGAPVGTDGSPSAVARCHALHVPAALAVGSVAELPVDDQRFDLIPSSDVLQHLTLKQASAASSEVAKVLRSGGRLVIRTNSVAGQARNRRAERLASVQLVGSSVHARTSRIDGRASHLGSHPPRSLGEHPPSSPAAPGKETHLIGRRAPVRDDYVR
jgi:2-polyprenyl-3-methyl-5-hydroxy-6-metoxy-1,4-benzoquinol methylase